MSVLMWDIFMQMSEQDWKLEFVVILLSLQLWTAMDYIML